MSRMMTTRNIAIGLLLIALAEPAGQSSEAHADHEEQMIEVVSSLNSNLSEKDAKEVAAAIMSVTQSEGCDVSWDLLLSVAMKESSLRKHAHNPETDDYGIMQINEVTISKLKLNKKRLLNDVKYAFFHGCSLLTQNKKAYSNRVPYWIGLYNAGVKLNKPIVVKNAKTYDKAVKSILKQIRKTSTKIYTANNSIEEM